MQQNKPVIIAICGKSSVGKDTFARWTKDMLDKYYPNVKTKIIVSDTTRPPRKKEIQNIDYNFISCYDFEENILAEEYLEYAKFRNWMYGTNKNSLLKGSTDINIGVFNPQGIKSLLQYTNEYEIKPVYVTAPVLKRLYRSIRREGKIRLEFFRRLYADYQDFKDIESLFKKFDRVWRIKG